jgi:hypothetical protein
MAIVATAASPTANSYIDLATADSMAASAGLSRWAEATEDARNAALIRAAVDVDTHRFHHATPWNIDPLCGQIDNMPVGLLANADLDPSTYVRKQALIFPRRVDRGVIPNPIKWCQMFQAEFIATSGEYDRKQWEGANAAPLADSKVGSPLCPRALSMISRFISRAGAYSG